MPTAINPKIAYPKANGPITLAQSAVPVILAPNGTIATNGIVTLGTALPTTYSGGAWVRFPAGAVSGGAAGLYWTVFTSTTQGQVSTTFIDPATQFIPYIPTGLTNAVGSNSAYTQTTAADITLANITVPGGLMGPNGAVRSYVKWLNNNSAGVKQGKTSFGGQLAQTTGNITTSVGRHELLTIQNRGTMALQTAGSDNAGTGTAFNASNRAFAVNSALDVSLIYTGQLAVATDFVFLDALILEVLPS